jgi:hypothetical protein
MDSAMNNDLARSIKQTLIALLAPLRDSAASPDLLRDWLAPLGYTSTTTSDPALTQIFASAEAIGTSLEAIADGSLDSWDALTNLFQVGRQLQGLLTDLRQFAASADPSKAAATLPDEIMSLLLATWLRREHPILFRAGATLGIIAPRETGATDPEILVNDVVARYPRRRDYFRFDTIGALLTDPGTALEQAYFPNGLATAPDVRVAEVLFAQLASLARALGFAWRIERREVVSPPQVTLDPDQLEEIPDESPDDPTEVIVDALLP